MLPTIRVLFAAVIALSSVIVRADAQSPQPLTYDDSIPKSLQNMGQFAIIKRVEDHTLLQDASKDASDETFILDEFQMERQGDMNNWCWAATAKSVSAFYNKSSDWSQCKIASKALNRDCCSASLKRSCDVTGFLSTALCITDNYSNYNGKQRCDWDGSTRISLNFDTVAREIRAGHPIGVRIVWQIDGEEGGAHFVVIVGYIKDASGISYVVADPLREERQLKNENVLRHNYDGSGVWTHSYLTRPAQDPPQNISIVRSLVTSYTTSTAETMHEPTLASEDIRFGVADNRYSALVEKARPFLDIGDAGALSSKIKQSILAMPHAIYVMGLRQVAASLDPLPKKPSGKRVLETFDGRLLAAYDFAGTDGAAVTLVGGVSAKSQIALLATGLRVAAKLEKKGSESPELRLLKVPSLNFEALWLHHGGSAEDVFIPVLSTNIPTGQPIGTRDLTIALRAFAKQRMESHSIERDRSAP